MRISTLFAAAILCASSCYGAPAIGMATGNSTITEGMQLETAAAASDVCLQNGVSLRLFPKSEGMVFSDHVVLEDGSLRAGHFNGYTIHAGDLQIQASETTTQAVVRMMNKTIEVASVGGNLNVTDGGAMLTRVASGTRMAFQQPIASAQTGQTPAHKKLPSEEHVMLWLIVATGAAALAIGLTAAAQGKSPF